MHWFGYSASYIFPSKIKDEVMLEYIGSKNISLSPVKYAAVFELTGGFVIPFETMVYDNTLICLYQGREDRCSRLKQINFGYQKTEHKSQVQTVTIKNLNPTNITLTLQPYSPPHPSIKLSISISKPYPLYSNPIKLSLIHI